MTSSLCRSVSVGALLSAAVGLGGAVPAQADAPAEVWVSTENVAVSEVDGEKVFVFTDATAPQFFKIVKNDSNFAVDVLVVGGGGAGGSMYGGGGGGGQVNYIAGQFPTTGLKYTVTVGAGGVVGAYPYSEEHANWASGGDGGISSLVGADLSFVALGGGGGAGKGVGREYAPDTVQNGGGGSVNSAASGTVKMTGYKGYAGGGGSSSNNGRGGGGASDLGNGNGWTDGNTSYNGKGGPTRSITGKSETYGSGGGGFYAITGASTGSGGKHAGKGGQTSDSSRGVNGSAADPGFGGGGGGGNVGGAGGSGTVIIRVKGACTVTLGGDEPGADEPVVVKKLIEKPTAVAGLVYTGEILTGVAEGEGYEVTGGTATEAGEHTATVTIDSANYRWAGDASDEPFELAWSIAKAQPTWTAAPSVSPTTWTAGEFAGAVTWGEAASGGAVSWTIDGVAVTEDGIETALNAAEKGRHAVTANAAETANYEGLEMGLSFFVRAASTGAPVAVWASSEDVEVKDLGDDGQVLVFTNATAAQSFKMLKNSANAKVDLLVVGGGGAGGSGQGGGGGGGQVSFVENRTLTVGVVYAVTVGAGGAVGAYPGTTSGWAAGGDGGISSFVGEDQSLFALGGGGGAGYQTGRTYAEGTVQNGGGCALNATTSGQVGYAGASAGNSSGGGGSSDNGKGNGWNNGSSPYCGKGGPTCLITGKSETYGSGGGGYYSTTDPNSGKGGKHAGNGGQNSSSSRGINGYAADSGFGGGGGGGSGVGGAGGSGTVIIRIKGVCDVFLGGDEPAVDEPVVVKKVAEKPVAATDLVYTGEALTGVVERAGYTVTGGVETNAGAYTATVTLDGENYRWADDSSDEPFELAWSIAKAQPTWTAAPSVSPLNWTVGAFAGEVVRGAATSGGEVSWTIDGVAVTEDGIETALNAAETGRHAVTVTVAATENYEGTETSFAFFVREKITGAATAVWASSEDVAVSKVDGATVLVFTDATAAQSFKMLKNRNHLAVDLLVVGGGGAGGNNYGGGGGGGQVVSSSQMLTAGEVYSVTVGAGGAVGALVGKDGWAAGGNGGRSSLVGADLSVVALGGGGGAGIGVPWEYLPGTIQNGGGFAPNGSGTGHATTSGQLGYAGGAADRNNAGGGGASDNGNGYDYTYDPDTSKMINNKSCYGREGVVSAITGSNETYGSGGGGGIYISNQSLGVGGAHAGHGGLKNETAQDTIGNGTAADPGFGGGGGGGGSGQGGAGGSGTVIIRIQGRCDVLLGGEEPTYSPNGFMILIK